VPQPLPSVSRPHKSWCVEIQKWIIFH